MENCLPHSHGTLPEHIERGMPHIATFGTVADILKLMSDPTRVRIFWLLCHGEQCVINLSALLTLSSPSVSHHLKLLKASGIVISRRDGKEVYYSAAKTPRTEILHSMIEEIIEVACPTEAAFEESRRYDSSVGTVNEIHRLITSNPSHRYTVEELASRFHINQTTLKSTFKTVFGQPIATYMKEHHISRAKELLRHSDMLISDIALELGYENPSKFSQAFKRVTGVLPREYRNYK